MKSPAEILDAIGRVIDSDEVDFIQLVRVAGLSPERDFRNADLSGLDLSKKDLTKFDFRGALLVGTNLRGSDLRGTGLSRGDLESSNYDDTTEFDDDKPDPFAFSSSMKITDGLAEGTSVDSTTEAMESIDDVIGALEDVYGVSKKASSFGREDEFIRTADSLLRRLNHLKASLTRTRHRNEPLYRIAYEEWKHWPEVDLPTAAAIWSGRWDDGDASRHVCFRNLKWAIDNGYLRPLDLGARKANRLTKVKPADLKTFFEGWPSIRDESGPPSIAAFGLTKLRKEGVEIRNDAAFLGVKFCGTCDQWAELVEDAIEEIDAADAEWFSTLDAVPDPRVPPPSELSESQLKCYREHDYKLLKLDSLVRRHLRLDNDDLKSDRRHDVLSLGYTDGGPNHEAYTKVADGRNAIWVRVSVENKSQKPLTKCVAYVTEVIHLLDERSTSLLSEEVLLRWSNRPRADEAAQPRAVFPGRLRYADVLSLVDGRIDAELQIWPMLNRYTNLIQRSRHPYFVTVLVLDEATGVESPPLQLRLLWTGRLETSVISAVANLIPFDEAARRVYSAVRDLGIEGVTDSGGDFIASRALALMVHAHTGEIQLYGVETPSTIQLPIPKKWCDPEALQWATGVGVHLDASENGHGFRQLSITAVDLERHVDWLRSGMPWPVEI